MRVKRVMLIALLIISSMIILIGCDNLSEKQEYTTDDEYVLEITNGKRFFKSEVAPKSKAEEVILDYFKLEISDEYDNFKFIFIDSDAFNHYPETYKEKFNEELYTEEVVVHSLTELREEDYSDDSEGIKYYPYMDGLEAYAPIEFKVIEAVYTNKVTDKLDEIAQWGSGNWTRYFVVVKEKEDSQWRIYDVYGHM